MLFKVNLSYIEKPGTGGGQLMLSIGGPRLLQQGRGAQDVDRED